jgi:hypothetical protein
MKIARVLCHPHIPVGDRAPTLWLSEETIFKAMTFGMPFGRPFPSEAEGLRANGFIPLTLISLSRGQRIWADTWVCPYGVRKYLRWK